MKKERLNKWNWSTKKQKWVFVEEVNGKRTYKYSNQLPDGFLALSEKLTILNRQMMTEENPDKKNNLFRKMMEISEKMQEFRID